MTAYTGYSLAYLLVYTVVSLFVLVPTIFLVAGNIVSGVLACAAGFTLLYVSHTLHTVTTMKALFAYSTVIMYVYLLLVHLH